jgi:hypothetical protein
MMVRPIGIYWQSFEGDYIPPDTAPTLKLLIRLAYFMGALMTIRYKVEVTEGIAERHQGRMLRRYRADVNNEINVIHSQLRYVIAENRRAEEEFAARRVVKIEEARKKHETGKRRDGSTN